MIRHKTHARRARTHPTHSIDAVQTNHDAPYHYHHHRQQQHHPHIIVACSVWHSVFVIIVVVVDIASTHTPFWEPPARIARSNGIIDVVSSSDQTTNITLCTHGSTLWVWCGVRGIHVTLYYAHNVWPGLCCRPSPPRELLTIARPRCAPARTNPTGCCRRVPRSRPVAGGVCVWCAPPPCGDRRGHTFSFAVTYFGVSVIQASSTQHHTYIMYHIYDAHSTDIWCGAPDTRAYTCIHAKYV